MLRRFVAKALLAAALSPALASAQVVYDNGAPNASGGNEMTQWVQAEDFTLASATTITGIRFWGFGFTPSAYQGSIVWSIYGNNGSQPGALLFSGTSFDAPIDQGAVANANQDNQLQFDIATNFALGAGTYWLGLHNGPLTTTNRADFYWQNTASNGSLTGREDAAPFGDNGWSNNGEQHAFQLSATTTVPEPSTYALMGSGLAALLLVRRRRRA